MYFNKYVNTYIKKNLNYLLLLKKVYDYKPLKDATTYFLVNFFAIQQKENHSVQIHFYFTLTHAKTFHSSIVFIVTHQVSSPRHESCCRHLHEEPSATADPVCVPAPPSPHERSLQLETSFPHEGRQDLRRYCGWSTDC